jgi:tRNA pseudouridine38-40 synthase
MSGGYGKRAFRVAYDGRGYRGFQRQPDVETIESVIFEGISELSIRMDEAVPEQYSAAGRTDAGVSAVAQTICFHGPEWLKPRVLNSVLPSDIRVWGWVDVPSDFNARYSARTREYEYCLHAPVRERDDDVHRVASRLSGEHDFQRFTADNERTIRTISVGVDRDHEFLILTVRAAGFPRQLVRRLAHYIRMIAEGDPGVPSVKELVDEDWDMEARMPPAPPEPLVLTDVSYEVDFQVDETALASAVEVFTAQLSSMAAQTRMTESILSCLNDADE